jgi:3-oxoadipate enol-lactonase
VTENWVEANGISLRYELAGDTGLTVVLLHEMGGTLESWDGLVPTLLGAGYRVLRYDQRGCGGSEKPRGEIGQRDLAEDLAALLDLTVPSGPRHLVGVAASCVSVLTLAAEQPHAVASVALCNPVTGVTVERGAALRQRAAGAEAAGLRTVLPETLDRSWPPDLGDPEAYRRYRARYLANDPACFAAHNRALIGVDVGPAVRGLRCPVLVLAGRSDQVRPADASRTFAASLPSAGFRLVDSAHMMPAQAPGELGQVLVEFLLDVDQGESQAASSGPSAVDTAPSAAGAAAATQMVGPTGGEA